ncbi:hypothetical protein [Caulobacter segnis]
MSISAVLNERRLVALLLLILWLCSLLLPVVVRPGAPGMGWVILLVGWLGALVGQFGWFANLGFLASFGLSLGKRDPSGLDLTASVLTLAAAIDALFWRRLYGDNGSVPIEAFGAGYYVWFVAIVGMAGWVIWLWTRTRRRGDGAHPDQDGNFSSGPAASA